METKLNVTKGEVSVSRSGLYVNSGITTIADFNFGSIREGAANAKLFSDALNTHNTTGKTPSELLQERDELLEALREIKNSEHGTYKGTATYLKKVASDAIENFLTKHSTNV